MGMVLLYPTHTLPIAILIPLGVTIYHLAKVINGNGEHARFTQELKYKKRRTKYITHHNLNIVS